MHFPRISFLAGAALSAIPIALGIVAVATRIWLRIKSNDDDSIVATYGLFHLNTASRTIDFDYPASQGLIIAGIIAIAVGVLVALLLDIVIKNRWIHLIAILFLYAGPTLIFIGLLLYAKRVFEAVGDNRTTLFLGYSIILAIIACLLGFLLAIYFAFVAGTHRSGYHNRTGRILAAPVIVTDTSERF